LRGDDAVGLLIVNKLKGKLPNNIILIEAENTPENFISKIEDENPSHIIIFDAANLEIQPGGYRIISQKELIKTSVSTHTLPLSIFIELIQRVMRVEVITIGIQPKTLEFAEKQSEEINEAINKIVKNISEIIYSINK
jgi:hydrogenase 3 maturation protease